MRTYAKSLLFFLLKRHRITEEQENPCFNTDTHFTQMSGQMHFSFHHFNKNMKMFVHLFLCMVCLFNNIKMYNTDCKTLVLIYKKITVITITIHNYNNNNNYIKMKTKNQTKQNQSKPCGPSLTQTASVFCTDTILV